MTDPRSISSKQYSNSNVNSSNYRDSFGINNSENNEWETNITANNKYIKEETNLENKLFKAPINLKSLLNNLPKPQNNFELDLSENLENLENLKQQDIKDMEVDEEYIEDNEDKTNRLLLERQLREQENYLNQTLVTQRNLLRPLEINYNYSSYIDMKIQDDDYHIEEENASLDFKQSEHLIKNELLKLLENDAINFPLKGAKINIENEDSLMTDISLEEKNYAKQLVQEQIEILNKKYNVSDIDDQIRKDVQMNELFYIPDVQKYCHLSEIETNQIFDSYKEMFEIKKDIITAEDHLTRKLEEKANILTNGYVKRNELINKNINALVLDILELKEKEINYLIMKNNEDTAIIKREQLLKLDIERIKEKERKLQSLYRNYQNKINELELK